MNCEHCGQEIGSAGHNCQDPPCYSGVGLGENGIAVSNDTRIISQTLCDIADALKGILEEMKKMNGEFPGQEQAGLMLRELK